MATDPTNPTAYNAVKYAIKGSESSHTFFKNGRLIQSKKSSAKGPYQIIDSTWNSVNKTAQQRYGKSLNWNDPASHDLAMNILMENYTTALKSKNLPINATTLYMMHFKGDANWVQYALKNPGAPASDVFNGDELSANRTILPNKNLGQVMQFLNRKINKNLPKNYTTNKMASITDNNSPAYAQAQNLSPAEKSRIIQQYKVQARLLKGKALSDYNDQMYKNGYIGYDEAGNWTGFIAEGVESQMSANEKKANDKSKSERIALRAVGEVMRDGLKQSNDGVIRINPEVAETKLRTAINKLGKEFPKDLSVRKELDDIIKSIPKDKNSRSFMEGMYDAITGNEKSGKPQEIMPFYEKLQSYYSKTSGTPVEFFKKNTINVDGPNGKVVQMTVPNAGKDIDFSQGHFRFAPNNGKGLDVENPNIKNGFQRDIVAPNFNPALKPEVDSIEGIDNMDTYLSMPTYEGGQLPALTDLEYNKMLPDTERLDDAENRKYNNELSDQGKVASDKASSERAGMTEEQTAEQERQNRIADSMQNFGMERPDSGGKYDADPSTFKSKLPLADLASGAIGIALGRSMMEEDEVWRDEELNNSFMAHIYEQRRISGMGMNPTEEAAAKEAVANSYQLGLQNIVNNSSGNRALILGNLANLDNINSKRMSEIALKDVEIKQRASEEYGRAMDYVQQFNSNKSVANNERKYQQAVLRSYQGTAVLAGAFRSMSEALGSYHAPNSPENMYKIHAQVKNMGWSSLVKDDGEGTNKWSYSWYQKQNEKTKATAKEESDIYDRIQALPKEEREKFAEETYSMNRRSQYSYARQILGEKESNQGETNVLDENGNVVSSEPTQSNGATVPINKTVVQNTDGSQTMATPMAKTTADGTSASTPQSPNEVTGMSTQKNTIFDKLQPEPIKVENIRTSDGRNLNLQKNTRPETKFGIAQNDFNPNQVYAESLGLENLYSDASQINEYYNQFGEDEDERSQNIRNALNNNA